jgi:hypothetical protein
MSHRNARLTRVLSGRPGAREVRDQPRTMFGIIARAGMPRLWDLDPVTRFRIRSSRATDRRYATHRETLSTSM